MDPTKNPFAPGAGTQPPELAGRDQILTDAEVALARLKLGRAARGQLLLGLRGVGKTVLLNRIAELAAGSQYLSIALEAPENRPLAELLVPPLRSILFQLSRREAAKEGARRALAVLRSFASAFKVRAGDIEFEVAPATGTADSGNLESDLPTLLQTVAEAAKSDKTAVALFVDELQYLSPNDLSALIVSVHKIGQDGLPFILFGAGLPQLAALAGEAKSYAERLFEFPDVGPLPIAAAMTAIREPLTQEGVQISGDALDVLVDKTKGYPYFLQEWGYHAWNVAEQSPITAADVHKATEAALAHLDAAFFRVRLDRLTPREEAYVRAMAELGPGSHRSGAIAKLLAVGVSTVGPIREALIRKGIVYSPRHGDTAFTVPMFDEFMRRSIPNWTPSATQSGETGARHRRRPNH